VSDREESITEKKKKRPIPIISFYSPPHPKPYTENTLTKERIEETTAERERESLFCDRERERERGREGKGLIRFFFHTTTTMVSAEY
jgi:hypothetical protein